MGRMRSLSPARLFRHEPDNFQIMSDLHLEFDGQYSTFVIPPRAPYLVLAGNIGKLQDYEGLLGFLAAQCLSFQRVFLVLGNHEFWGVSRSEGLALAEKLEQEPVLGGKFSVLNRTRVDISDSITVLGCTLQSEIPLEHSETVQKKVKDFWEIRDWSVDNHNAEHLLDFIWLRREIKAIRTENASRASLPRRILIVTHHAPSTHGSIARGYETNPCASASATELLDGKDGLLPFLKSQTWVFGHTHFSTYLERDGLRLISNQRGYVSPHTDVGNPAFALLETNWFDHQHHHLFDVKKTIRI